MKVKATMVGLLVLTVFLVACNSNTASETAVTEMQSASQIQSEGAKPQPATNHETLLDKQGAVKVVVTPLNLEAADSDTVAFEVAMDTHSVDLSMDLAALAMLTTDNGNEMSATLWDAQPGGHHVSGILSFPNMLNGAAFLAGASQLTLTIRDVDAPERVFSWQLNK